MLRVEAGSLPSQHPLRSRRLHPSDAPAPRRGESVTRDEILPPPDEASPPEAELRLPTPSFHSLRGDRWNVRLELTDDEIARLYAQGLTRGALVWKKGMPEWRPLLSTPELAKLLQRTRITIREASPPDLDDEPTLPRPARLPSGISAWEAASEERALPTVAPTALDVEQQPRTARRSGELVVALAVGFAAAWLGHVGMSRSPAAGPLAAAASVAAEPAIVSAPAPSALALPSSTIPIVAVSALPLLGAAPETALASAGPGRPQRSARSSAAGPSRSDLVAALTRVGQAASGCGERGGPVRVVLSFGASGVARSIQVSGSELPAQTRSCIIGAASRARVPAFNGDPVTVSKTL